MYFIPRQYRLVVQPTKRLALHPTPSTSIHPNLYPPIPGFPYTHLKDWNSLEITVVYIQMPSNPSYPVAKPFDSTSPQAPPLGLPLYLLTNFASERH